MFPIKPHMWLFLASPFMGAATANDLPIVNLGYQLHQAIAFNVRLSALDIKIQIYS